jgi:hypothetical protein
VNTTLPSVSNGQRLRYATHASPALSNSRYEKSPIGRFSPEDNNAGVAKPPINPSSAMNIESRRMESPTATAVTTSIRKNTTPAGSRCQSA